MQESSSSSSSSGKAEPLPAILTWPPLPSTATLHLSRHPPSPAPEPLTHHLSGDVDHAVCLDCLGVGAHSPRRLVGAHNLAGCTQEPGAQATAMEVSYQVGVGSRESLKSLTAPERVIKMARHATHCHFRLSLCRQLAPLAMRPHADAHLPPARTLRAAAAPHAGSAWRPAAGWPCATRAGQRQWSRRSARRRWPFLCC